MFRAWCNFHQVFCFCFFSVLEIKPRALHLLSRCSSTSTELYLQPKSFFVLHSCLFFFWMPSFLLCVPFIHSGICLTTCFFVNRKEIGPSYVIEKHPHHLILDLYPLTGQVFSQQEVLHYCPEMPWSAAPCAALCPLCAMFFCIFFLFAEDWIQGLPTELHTQPFLIF